MLKLQSLTSKSASIVSCFEKKDAYFVFQQHENNVQLCGALSIACSIQRRCLAEDCSVTPSSECEGPSTVMAKRVVTVEACCYHGGDIADCKKTLGLPKYYFLQSLALQGSLPFPESSVVARFFSSLEPGEVCQRR